MALIKSLLAVLSIVVLTSANVTPTTKSKRQLDPTCALACFLAFTDVPAALEACVVAATTTIDPAGDVTCPLDAATAALVLDACNCVTPPA